jgi:DNA (cytosine-5)-methyltransferase 1
MIATCFPKHWITNLTKHPKNAVRAKPLTVAEVYCGAGGLSAGFKQAKARWKGNCGERFEIVYGVDRDREAISTFRDYHFPGRDPDFLNAVAPCKDVSSVTAKEVLATIKPQRRLDVLIGGPSCQGVSPAGLRNPNDNRNAMLLAFIRLVQELRPRWFLMENVPGLAHSNNRELLGTIFEKFEAIEGYEVAGDVLLAADYGVPQLRYRLFIIGTTTGIPIRFPGTYHQAKNGAQPYPTVRSAIFDLRKYPAITAEDYNTNRLRLPSNGCPSNHYYRNVTDITRRRMQTIKTGEDWRYMPVQLLPEGYFATRASDQKGAYGRLLWDWPAYTMTNSCSNVTAGVFTHPEFDRVLSVREAARLQTFEDAHVFKGSVEAQYRQVGNAVPPKLAQAVAESILYCHHHGKGSKLGVPGRITRSIILAASNDPRLFPILTPRKVHPQFDRRHSRKARPSRTRAGVKITNSVWDAPDRLKDPRPEETRILRKLATQPANYRAAKRARTIVQFIDGLSKEQILKQANVSETSIRKWIDGYFNLGLEGWRAYHTPVDAIKSKDSIPTSRIKTAVDRVRRTLLSRRRNGQPASNGSTARLHMNGYLSTLIKRYSKLSVADLICEVEQELEHSLGTVYVADLLAIADVVVSPRTLKAGRARRQLSKQPSNPSNTPEASSHKTRSMPTPAKNATTNRR